MKKMLFLLAAVCTFLTPVFSANGMDTVISTDSEAVPLEQTADGKAILALLYANTAAAQKKDLQASLDQLVLTGGKAREAAKQQLQQLFRCYTLDYRLEKIRILKINGNSAEVEVVQVTRLVKKADDAPVYRDNRVRGIHYLKKVGGQWKFLSMRFIKIDYLNENNQTEAR